MLRRLRSLWRDRRGSALLEATVVTPFLFVLTFGVYEFSWFFYRQHLTSTGVHDAARYLARTSLNPCEASNAANQTNAKNIATNGVTSGGMARVPGWTASNVTISCPTISRSVCGAATPCVLGTGANLRLVTVSTSYTPATLGLLGFFGFSAPTISVSHQERAVGRG